MYLSSTCCIKLYCVYCTPSRLKPLPEFPCRCSIEARWVTLYPEISTVHIYLKRYSSRYFCFNFENVSHNFVYWYMYIHFNMLLVSDVVYNVIFSRSQFYCYFLRKNSNTVILMTRGWFIYKMEKKNFILTFNSRLSAPWTLF